MVDLAQMAKGIGLGVWAAIEQFQATATATWIPEDSGVFQD